MVDFRRIAILEPTLVFPRPLSAMVEKEIISHTRQWAEVTLENEADAWYFRFHGDYEFLAMIKDALTSYTGVTHLVPFPAREIAQSGDAVHFRKGDAGILAAPERVDHNITFKGISCHSLEELHKAQSQAFDYAFYSPIFKTKSHPEALPIGLELLKKACEEISIPVFALGGVNEKNEISCLNAGAFGIAGIRMFME